MRRVRITLLLSLITTLTLNIILTEVLKDLPFSLFKFQLITHMDQFDIITKDLTPVQIQTYINHLIIDYFYLVSYSVFLCSILKRVKIRLYLLPLLAGITDLGENIIQHLLFTDPTLKSELLIKISGSLSRIKWLTVFIVAILFLTGLIRRGLMRRG